MEMALNGSLELGGLLGYTRQGKVSLPLPRPPFGSPFSVLADLLILRGVGGEVIELP